MRKTLFSKGLLHWGFAVGVRDEALLQMQQGKVAV